MGHYRTYQSFPRTASRKDIYEARSLVIEDEGARQHGHLLSSDNGFTLHDSMIYDSWEEAKEAIDRFDNGWYDDHGVLYRDYSSIKPTKQMVALTDKKREWRDKRAAYAKDNDIHNRKSGSISCPNCKSRLTLSFFTGNNCPVCGTELRSDTVMHRLSAFTAKIRDCDAKRAELEKKQKEKAEVKWLVKLEFHV